jgi:predicted RNase H-like HicB family nuclease
MGWAVGEALTLLFCVELCLRLLPQCRRKSLILNRLSITGFAPSSIENFLWNATHLYNRQRSGSEDEKGESMKVRRLNRRTYNVFTSFDAATGYAVRFAQTRNGKWCGKPDAFMALCGGKTINQVKKLVSEAIQIHLEAAVENDWPIPEPENAALVK